MSSEDIDQESADSQEESWVNTEQEEEADDINFEILNYPADTTLKGYHDQWKKDQLEVPNFQRKYVWTQPQASKLIESFLLGLTVPGVFLYKEHDSSKYIVIDGQQRIRTIVNFFSGTFKNKKFILQKVNKKWEGKAFEDLTEKERFKLETAVMRSTIIQQLSPQDNQSIYHIFERLNTGGTKLTPMEVRMCVADGKFVNMLKELNKESDWRKLLKKEEEDKRSRDKELILRILALCERQEEYSKPMKKFLNKYVHDHKNADQQKMIKLKESFLKAVKKATSFQEKPFRLGRQLNFSFMESVFVALIRSPMYDKNQLCDAYKKLIEDEEYLRLIKEGQNSKQDTNRRIEIAEREFSNGK